MSKAQATVEFVIAFTMIMFLFMAAMAALNEFFWDQDSLNAKEMDLFLEGLEKSLNLALITEGSIQMPFVFPQALGGRGYNVSIIQDPEFGMTSVEIFYPDYDQVKASRYVPAVINKTDLNQRGEYFIIKNSSGLYIIP